MGAFEDFAAARRGVLCPHCHNDDRTLITPDGAFHHCELCARRWAREPVAVTTLAPAPRVATP